ncbi:MAG: DUF4129 domain-containing transglutaminase family protein [Armatimonadota bacterium]
MSTVAVKNPELQDRHGSALPLYVASLLVTLAGIGAVGMTLGSSSWLWLWASLAAAGHAASYALRRMSFNYELVFIPVMLVGSAVTIQQLISGGPLASLDGQSALSLPPDLATAVLVSCLSVVRCFTLLKNAALLFSPVPSITMLALAASSNPNPEIPIFFVMTVLGALFLTGYESHLQRAQMARRKPAPAIFHLGAAWTIVLVLSAVGLAFPFLVRPVLSRYSPYGLPAAARLRGLMNFTQASTTQAPIGAGPISLSPNPVYEVYAAEGGRLRTAVFTRYTGRSWNTEQPENASELPSDQQVEVRSPDPSTGITAYNLFEFRLAPDPDQDFPVPVRQVRQRFRTVGTASQGIPGLGRIRELRYPKSNVSLHISGALKGTGHNVQGKFFEVISDVPDLPPQALESVPSLPVERLSEVDPETLSLPPGTSRVQELAQKITSGIDSPHLRIQALIQHIEKSCTYSLQEEFTPIGKDAVDHYLFETRKGACDLAASAVAVMCRSIGIPARVAVGYVADEPLESGGGFLVRQEDAHMWVETYHAGLGWVPYDPAPPLRDLKQTPLQAAAALVRDWFSQIGSGGFDAALLVLAVSATLAMAILHLWRRVRARVAGRRRWDRSLAGSPAEAVAARYALAMELLERRGWGREPWQTPSEYLARLRSDWRSSPDALAAMEQLTASFELAHYGGSAGEEEVRAAASALEALRRSVPEPPGRKPAVEPAGSPA